MQGSEFTSVFEAISDMVAVEDIMMTHTSERGSAVDGIAAVSVVFNLRL